MAVVAEVDIANLALISLGDRRITSLDDAAIDPNQQGPTRAEIMRELFDPTRDEVFSLHPWNCLIRRAELAEVLPVPLYGFAHGFTLPAGGVPPPVVPDRCLRVIDTSLDETWERWDWWTWGGWGTSWGISRSGLWQIEDRTLVTDETTIKVRYIGRSLNVPAYAPHLVHVLHRALAWKGAEAMQKGNETVDRMEKQYERAKNLARNLDGREGGIRIARSTVLTEVR